MRTLKLKTQPTLTFFTAVNQISRHLQKETEVFGSMGSQSHVCTLLFTDFNPLSQFLYFCGQSIVNIIMIDSSKTPIVGCVQSLHVQLLKGAVTSHIAF